MKYLLVPFIFLACSSIADAQNVDWFKGTWYGLKSFTDARIGIRVLVRIEVDSIRGNRFSGRFIYMYPKDTLSRLIKTFDGNFKERTISLNKSKELYLLDPRSRSFWSNCSQCNETGRFYIKDSNLVFRITTASCGDSCNGESFFLRNLDSYDASTETAVRNFFSNDKSAPTAKTNSKQKSGAKNTSTPVKDNANDTLAAINIDSVAHVIRGEIPAAANMSINRREESAVSGKKILIDTADNKQPVASMTNKQSVKHSDSVSKSVAATQTLNAPKKNSSPQQAANQTTPQTEILKDKDDVSSAKKASADTSKTKQSLTAVSQVKSAPANNDTIQSQDSAALIDVNSLKEKMSRETELIRTYQVDSPHIQVDLFDNGEIDQDIVSVYYNGQLIINHVTLTDTALSFHIEASAAHRYHEFILIAENEGSIPPNTALMRIKAGRQQYKLTVSTSSIKNAKVAIDYLGY